VEAPNKFSAAAVSRIDGSRPPVVAAVGASPSNTCRRLPAGEHKQRVGLEHGVN
jgi:hypothetical protein